MVSRRRHRLSQKHAEQNSVCFCANISHAKAQSLAKSARGGLTQKTRETQNIAPQVADFFSTDYSDFLVMI